MSAMTTCNAIAAFVAAVSKATQARRILRRIAFKVGAGEVVEQHFILRIEEIAPPLREMIEQRALMFEQQIVALVEMMLLSQTEVAAEQVRDRAVIKPMPVQSPFTARIDKPIKHQCLQHQIPTRALAAHRQVLAPKSIQTKLPPQLAAQPASTPLTRATQRHLREPHAHDGQCVIIDLDRRMLLCKERHLLRRILILPKDIHRLAPRSLLPAVEFTKIQHMSLHDATIMQTAVLLRAASRRSPLRGSLRLATSSLGSTTLQ